MRRMVGVMGRSMKAAGFAAVLFYGVTAATGVAVAESASPYESVKDNSQTMIPALEEAQSSRQSPRRRPVEMMDGTGPISAHQCMWLGKRIINLLIRDDAMAANDFGLLYSRFECSETHLADAFGCLVANLGAIENGALADQVDDCWHDPALRVPLKDAASSAPADEPTAGADDDAQPSDAAAPAAQPAPPAPEERPQAEQPPSGTAGQK